MANASMISSTIQNYKRLQERRIVFEFGLSYDTPTEAVKKAPVIVEEIIKSQDQVRRSCPPAWLWKGGVGVRMRLHRSGSWLQPVYGYSAGYQFPAA